MFLGRQRHLFVAVSEVIHPGSSRHALQQEDLRAERGRGHPDLSCPFLYAVLCLLQRHQTQRTGHRWAPRLWHGRLELAHRRGNAQSESKVSSFGVVCRDFAGF